MLFIQLHRAAANPLTPYQAHITSTILSVHSAGTQQTADLL